MLQIGWQNTRKRMRETGKGMLPDETRQRFELATAFGETLVPDIFTKEKRSLIMSRIRGRGNKATEMAFVTLLRQYKITGWRRHLPLFGSPDFTFRKQRLIVFVDGCFWHACPKHAIPPSTNPDFWSMKFSRNKARDRRVNRILRKNGWRVIRLWEHDIGKRPMACLLRIQKHLTVAQNKQPLE